MLCVTRERDEDYGEYRPKVEPRFFTLEEVAIYLNVSVPQVYSLVRSGDLPAVRSVVVESGALIESV
jgi:hypothetical protein